MIFTARQLQELHKSNGQVRLPIGARLTPMAADFVRSRKIAIVYGDDVLVAKGSRAVGGDQATGPYATAAPVPISGNVVLWWCDGPCGQAKAAIASQARESNLQPIGVTAEPKFIVPAIKHLANEIRNDRATAGILLVQSAAAAGVFANRCPSLRAIVGTCRDAVQQGVELLSANVLIVEHPYQTLQQVRNLLTVFLKPRRPIARETEQQLRELATCA